MKLLLLAQTPPPLHGQSLMVDTAVRGLPNHGIEVAHVNLRLSRNHADIGGWRAGKILAILDACFHAIVARCTENCDTLYYVPAPGKRGALYRDWLVMLLVRPFYRRLVLHFHNGGLGDWLETRATPLERSLTQVLLGRADLAIVLTQSLRSDAAALHARCIAVVPNGIAPAASAAAPRENFVLFLGAVSGEKGALDLLAAIQLLRARGHATRVVFAGPVEPTVRAALDRARAADPGVCHEAGMVSGKEKADLLARCGVVCLPTHYPHEGQPLVALEALSADAPVVATRWRGLPETLPPTTSLVAPGDTISLAAALAATLAVPPPAGAHREFFEARYTRERHLAMLARALRDALRA